MNKVFITALGFMLLLTACREKHTMQVEDEAVVTENEAPKGELAFLLQYGGRLPDDVGFLTNHIVERRLAGIMKDSFQVLSTKTAYSTPITVAAKEGFVAAKYFNDKEKLDLSSMIIIDTRNDIFWVYYYNADSLVKFTDNPSSAVPDMP